MNQPILDAFERETLFDLLQESITEHSIQAQLKYLSKEISKDRLEWHLGHALHLRSIKAKLLPVLWPGAKP